MNLKPFLPLLGLCLPASGALVWTGAGDGISLFQEANFLDDNGAVPANGTINGNTAVTAVTGGEIEITSGVGTPSAFGGGFTLGANNLTLDGGKVLQSTGTSGINGTGGQTLAVLGISTVNVQYITNLGITLDGGSTLRYRGGGNPVNSSTINIVDMGSVLQFSNETYAAFDAEHSGKVTANGAALVFGTDPFVSEPGDNALASAFNGANGVQIQVIPEPGTSAFLLLSGLSLSFRRRK